MAPRTLAILILLVPTGAAPARTYQGTPATYRDLVGRLEPGDVLELAAGDYDRGLSIRDLAGTPDRWIVIRGPRTGRPARFPGDRGRNRNTIEITGSSFVALQFLTIDGLGVPDIFAISAKGGPANRTHDIRIEGCTIVGHGAGQQTVGISTKCPTWGWRIRANRIVGAGTGMYLGNSDGEDPFVGGLIEGNLIEDPIGYCLQIKHQNARRPIEGMPDGRSTTIVRHNVFVKGDRPSEHGDRPNVLVGTFPPEGPGSDDRYEIYGNVFVHNPRENLIQATGRVTIHDNLFVGGSEAAILVTDHNGPLRLATIYHNTIHACARGIVFGTRARDRHAVVGNLILVDGEALAGPIEVEAGNATGRPDDGRKVFSTAGTTLGRFDLYPRRGAGGGEALSLEAFADDTDHDRDFNGTAKGRNRHRGAYAGSGRNPGWKPIAGPKPLGG